MYETRAVIQMDIDGCFLKEFTSCKLASKLFGGTNHAKARIYNACSDQIRRPRNGGRKPNKKFKDEAYGYRWKFKED